MIFLFSCFGCRQKNTWFLVDLDLRIICGNICRWFSIRRFLQDTVQPPYQMLLTMLNIFPAFSTIQRLCSRYGCRAKSLILSVEWCLDRLLFPVHASLVLLKFCSVRKCAITQTAFVRQFFSLLIKLFLRFPFVCHTSIGIQFDIRRRTRHYLVPCIFSAT